MRITEAAALLGSTPRMMRYRETLGLLPPVRPAARRRSVRAAPRSAGPGHRKFSDADLAAMALGLSIEQRYDISPVALAFGLRVLAEPQIRAEVAEFGRRIGRIQPLPTRALDFEQERALRLLQLDQPGSRPRRSPCRSP
jgi:MerR family transcriptional regulator, copper efflux regulator